MSDLFADPRRNLAHAMAQTTRCPACSSEQVQVVDCHAEPMAWRCRTCRHPWTIATQPPPPVHVTAISDADLAGIQELMARQGPQSLFIERPDDAALLRLALVRILAVPTGTKGLGPKDRAARLHNAIEDMRRIARDALHGRGP